MGELTRMLTHASPQSDDGTVTSELCIAGKYEDASWSLYCLENDAGTPSLCVQACTHNVCLRMRTQRAFAGARIWGAETCHMTVSKLHVSVPVDCVTQHAFVDGDLELVEDISFPNPAQLLVEFGMIDIYNSGDVVQRLQDKENNFQSLLIGKPFMKCSPTRPCCCIRNVMHTRNCAHTYALCTTLHARIYVYTFV